MQEIVDIKLSRQALKDLKRIPVYIVMKLQAWIDDVGHRGLVEVRKISGYHDEPLQGERQGQRSIRLSQTIYSVNQKQQIQFVEIIEVNKHDY